MTRVDHAVAGPVVNVCFHSIVAFGTVTRKSKRCKVDCFRWNIWASIAGPAFVDHLPQSFARVKHSIATWARLKCYFVNRGHTQRNTAFHARMPRLSSKRRKRLNCAGLRCDHHSTATKLADCVRRRRRLADRASTVRTLHRTSSETVLSHLCKPNTNSCVCFRCPMLRNESNAGRDQAEKQDQLDSHQLLNCQRRTSIKFTISLGLSRCRRCSCASCFR